MLFDIFCCVFRKSLSLLIALFSIVSTESGMVTFSKEEQEEKANVPIVSTESGIVIFFKEGQLEKALSPIVFNAGDNLTEVRFSQDQKARSPIVITESGNEILSARLPEKVSPPNVTTPSGIAFFSPP